MRHAAQGWAVEGIAVRGDFGQLPGFASEGPVTLTLREACGEALAFRH